MEHRAKVGVVVPIWNVASYIEHCAESLMSQTLEDMQFVFVDDASPDNSIEILNAVLDRYPERKGQSIVVRHEVNKGLPTARKTGLEHINAEYVAHCDSDDWVEPTMYEKMYLSARSNDADMVVCDYYSGVEGIVSNFKEPVDGDMVKAYLHRTIPPYVWIKLTRTEIYRRVVFPKENYLEDWVQSVQVHAYSRVVNILHEPLYHHCINPSSITKINNSLALCDENLRQCMDNMKLVHDFVIDNHLAEEDDMVYMKILVRRRLYPKLMQRQGRRQYFDTYPELNHSLFRCRHLPWLLKVEHIIIWLGLFPEWRRFGMPVYNCLRKLKKGSAVKACV